MQLDMPLNEFLLSRGLEPTEENVDMLIAASAQVKEMLRLRDENEEDVYGLRQVLQMTPAPPPRTLPNIGPQPAPPASTSLPILCEEVLVTLGTKATMLEGKMLLTFLALPGNNAIGQVTFVEDGTGDAQGSFSLIGFPAGTQVMFPFAALGYVSHSLPAAPDQADAHA